MGKQYLLLLLAALLPAQQSPATSPDLRAGIRELEIAKVWSGHPVQFALLTRGDQQYVAYYDAERKMTVAQRTLGAKEWHYTILPSTVGWDSHNYITMAFDRDGYLHLAGNMHVSPLVYFRSSHPEDASSLERIASMTGRNEDRVTYPVFSYGPDGALLFEYRSGRSGAGNTFNNRYDERIKTWMPLTEEPLFEGGKARNAYPIHRVLGPDKFYHQVWIWRESPMAETNHDISYARSRDLVHWETAGGLPLKLPLRLDTPGLIVDPVPMKGGAINGVQSVGFDLDGKLVIAYTKYDQDGKSQLYFARFRDGKWQVQQASRWDYRWDFHGGGSIPMEIRVGSLTASHGHLTISIHHPTYGDVSWQVDPQTMQLVGEPAAGKKTAAVNNDALATRSASDLGGAPYRLTWETLGPNRDHAREGNPPPPSTLKLLVLK